MTQCWIKMYITMTMTQSTPVKAEATEVKNHLQEKQTGLRACDGGAACSDQHLASPQTVGPAYPDCCSGHILKLSPFSSRSVLGAFLSSTVGDLMSLIHDHH